MQTVHVPQKSVSEFSCQWLPATSLIVNIIILLYHDLNILYRIVHMGRIQYGEIFKTLLKHWRAGQLHFLILIIFSSFYTKVYVLCQKKNNCVMREFPVRSYNACILLLFSSPPFISLFLRSMLNLIFHWGAYFHNIFRCGLYIDCICFLIRGTAWQQSLAHCPWDVVLFSAPSFL